eukprot:COSAG02_NODE_694_length_18422_cov_19.850188_5_plen_288_part_00
MHAAERCAECCVALWPSAELPSAVSGAAVKSQVVKLQACHSFTARLFAGELHCHIRTSIGLDVIGADWAGDMSSIVQLREVGFWAVTGSTPADDQRPHPNPNVDEAWAQSPAAEQLASYLRVGYIESYEMGYSNCRFGGSGDGSCRTGPWMDMGCIALTDGEFVWPEGLVHYVERHAVRPPGAAGAALLAKATSHDGRDFVLHRRAAFAGGTGTTAALLEWDAQGGRPVRMPDSMADVVIVQSRLIAHRMQQIKHTSWNAHEKILGMFAIASLAAAVWKALAGWPAA